MKTYIHTKAGFTTAKNQKQLACLSGNNKPPRPHNKGYHQETHHPGWTDSACRKVTSYMTPCTWHPKKGQLPAARNRPLGEKGLVREDVHYEGAQQSSTETEISCTLTGGTEHTFELAWQNAYMEISLHGICTSVRKKKKFHVKPLHNYHYT